MGGAPRVFTPDQAREIAALHAAKKGLSYIVARYGHLPTVRAIIAGKAYRDVLHGNGACHCPSCLVNKRAEENHRRARAAKLDAVCAHCGKETKGAARLMMSRGHLVLCPACDGRNRQ